MKMQYSCCIGNICFIRVAEHFRLRLRNNINPLIRFVSVISVKPATRAAKSNDVCSGVYF